MSSIHVQCVNTECLCTQHDRAVMYIVIRMYSSMLTKWYIYTTDMEHVLVCLMKMAVKCKLTGGEMAEPMHVLILIVGFM